MKFSLQIDRVPFSASHGFSTFFSLREGVKTSCLIESTNGIKYKFIPKKLEGKTFGAQNRRQYNVFCVCRHGSYVSYLMENL